MFRSSNPWFRAAHVAFTHRAQSLFSPRTPSATAASIGLPSASCSGSLASSESAPPKSSCTRPFLQAPGARAEELAARDVTHSERPRSGVLSVRLQPPSTSTLELVPTRRRTKSLIRAAWSDQCDTLGALAFCRTSQAPPTRVECTLEQYCTRTIRNLVNCSGQRYIHQSALFHSVPVAEYQIDSVGQFDPDIPLQPQYARHEGILTYHAHIPAP